MYLLIALTIPLLMLLLVPLCLRLSNKFAPAFTTVCTDAALPEVFLSRRTDGTFRWPDMLQATPMTVIQGALSVQRSSISAHRGIPFWLSHTASIRQATLTDTFSHYVVEWPTSDAASAFRFLSVYAEGYKLYMWAGDVPCSQCQNRMLEPLMTPDLVFAHQFTHD